MKIRLRSAAKINLSLDILSRRADGYHELASVVHTIGLWDDLEVEIAPNRGEIEFSCNIAALNGADNLCVRAAQSWRDVAGEVFGVKIHLEKRIPSGAGLGGGSGNAAAILLALNRAVKSPLLTAQLNDLAARLGADVPLFLDGGAQLMEGIGEKLTPLAPLQGHVLVVKPAISFPTPAIFRVWDEGHFASQHDTPPLLAAWPGGDWKRIAPHCGNDFERAVAGMANLPARLIALLRDSGALTARMSGSGSACFGIFAENAAAQEAADRLKSELAKDVHLHLARCFVAPLSPRGIEFLD